MRARWAAGLVVLLAAAGCGETVDPLTKGYGTVVGSANGLSFDFSSRSVLATFAAAPGDGAMQDVTLALCEVECPPIGIFIAPSSRGVFFTLRVPPERVVAGAVFEIGPELGALAAARGFSSVELDVQSGRETELVPAVSGRLTFEAADFRARGQLRGTFDLRMQDGGALLGTFDAPLYLSR